MAYFQADLKSPISGVTVRGEDSFVWDYSTSGLTSETIRDVYLQVFDEDLHLEGYQESVDFAIINKRLETHKKSFGKISDLFSEYKIPLVFGKSYYWRIAYVLVGSNPRDPRTYGKVTQISSPTMQSFKVKNPIDPTPIVEKNCDPHDIPVAKKQSVVTSLVSSGCDTKLENGSTGIHEWTSFLRNYGTWFKNDDAYCTTVYKVYVPYDGKYELQHTVDNYAVFILYGNGGVVWSEDYSSKRNYLWKNSYKGQIELKKGFYLLTVLAVNGTSRPGYDNISPYQNDQTQTIDPSNEVIGIAPANSVAEGIDTYLKRTILRNDKLSSAKLKELFSGVTTNSNGDYDISSIQTVQKRLEKIFVTEASALDKLTEPASLSSGNPAAFAFSIKTVGSASAVSRVQYPRVGPTSSFNYDCYESDLGVFTTRTKLITPTSPKKNSTVYLPGNANNKVKFSWILPQELDIDFEADAGKDNYAVYFSIFSGSIASPHSLEIKHEKISPLSSSFICNPNALWPPVDSRHDFKLDQTYTWRVGLYNNNTKELLAVSYPQSFETKINDFKPRPTGPIGTFYDFISFKYDNGDKILDDENYFYDSNSVRNIYIDSDSYDSKDVTFTVDTNGMKNIASLIDTEVFNNRPEGFSGLSPYIKNCKLVIFSKRIIDADDDSIQFEQDTEISYADNGKPFYIDEVFKFDSSKIYLIKFNAKVYYYNNNYSYNESILNDYFTDEFENSYIVQFKKADGIKNFRTPQAVIISDVEHAIVSPVGTLKTWGPTGSVYYTENSKTGKLIERDGPLFYEVQAAKGYKLQNTYVNEADVTSNVVLSPNSKKELGYIYSLVFPSIAETITIDTILEPTKINIITSTQTLDSNGNIIPTVGGTIEPTGIFSVNEFSSFDFYASPNNGFIINDVKVDNLPINSYYEANTFDTGSGVGSIKNVTSPNSSQTIVASFKKTPVITLKSTGNGRIDPTGSFSVAFGSKFTFNAFPSDRNIIKKITYTYASDSGDIITESIGNVSTATISDIRRDYLVEAEFSSSPTDGEEPPSPILPPNYRVSDKKCQVCNSCENADGDFCKLYKFIFDPRNVCDSWEQKGIIQKNLISDGTEYLLNEEPYYGKYYLWSPNKDVPYEAYAGECIGSGSMVRLQKNQGKFCVLEPDFSKATWKQSTDTVNNYYSISTISTSSVTDELISKAGYTNRIELNVDYSDFKNFVLFSSAYDRILNFRDKVDKIESINFKISNFQSLGTITDSQVSQSLVNLSKSKTEIIKNLDDFEKYLYFESGSVIWKDYVTSISSSNYIKPWPKMTSVRPYVLYSTTASIATAYITELFQSASDYDINNFNSLKNRLPEYFRDEGSTEFGGYMRMMSMFGHYFDFLYLYSKELANRKFMNLNEKTNAPDAIIPYLLDYFNLFEKSKKVESNINEFLLRINSATSSSVSYLSGSMQDYTNELYLRLLNSAPYIMKSRGTKKSVKGVLNSFGISDEYIQVKEYGRTQTDFTHDSIDTKISKENVKRYYLDFYGTQNVRANWGYSTIPSSIQIRFKSTNNTGLYTTQVLLEGKSDVSGSWGIVLASTGSTYGDASGVIKFVLSGSISCSTAEIPVFNGIPWSIYLERDASSAPTYTYNLKAKQFYFDGINFSSTASLTNATAQVNNTYATSGSLYIGGRSTSISSPSPLGSPYYGKASELRLWNILIPSDVNDIFVKQPSFYGATHITSSTANLITWLRLDQDIDHSVTSSVWDYNLATAKNYGTASNFPSGAGTSYSNVWEEEQRVLNNIDVDTYSDDKIAIVTASISDNTLSPTQRKERSSQYLFGSDSNKLSIEISTNGIVNDDLLKSFQFNIFDYIGDTRFINSSSYGDLDYVRKQYVARYPSGSVNPFTIFNQAAGYDSAIISTLKKVVPYKADLSVGFKVEQTALERFKTKSLPNSRGTKNDNLILIHITDDMNLSSEREDYSVTLNIQDTISFNKSDKKDYTLNISVIDGVSLAKSNNIASVSDIVILDDMVGLARSAYEQPKSDNTDVYNFNKAVGKKDKYNTLLTLEPGFASYVKRSILPNSNFTVYYTMSGSNHVLAYDSATEPTWGVENGKLTTVYSRNHVMFTRGRHYRDIFRAGTTQVLKCEFDSKTVVEIVRTTSKAAIVYDTQKDDIILRAE